MPKVSVIIPVKDRDSELKRAINSAIDQTVRDIEVLVIDDKSSLNIQSIVEAYQDERIKYILNTKELSNANVCRNIGLEYAKGDYIAMLDSDDEWMPNHLENKIYFIKANSCDGVFGSYFVDNGSEKKDIISRQFKNEEKMINYLLTDGRAATPTHVYKGLCAKAIKWDESLLRHQDFDFSVRFAEKYKFLPSKEVTCIVHWRQGEKRKEDLSSQKRFIQKFKKQIDHNIYNTYHLNTFKSVYARNDISKDLKKYFKRESYRFIRSLSFNDFYSIISIDKKINYLGKAIYRVVYTFKYLFS
jgi:glycosyltransferase involved in cell wall biosynthesis